MTTQNSAINGSEIVEKNPIGLSDNTVEAVVSELNDHVASLFVLFHQYQKHHWLVEGPQFRDLHLYLEESYNAVHADLDEIAERITMLGGMPVSHPEAQSKRSYIEHEAEGMRAVRDMLKADLEGEQTVISRLRKTIRTTIDEGDFGTERLLKSVLYKAEDRAHHLDHYLEDNSLAK